MGFPPPGRVPTCFSEEGRELAAGSLEGFPGVFSFSSFLRSLKAAHRHHLVHLHHLSGPLAAGVITTVIADGEMKASIGELGRQHVSGSLG